MLGLLVATFLAGAAQSTPFLGWIETDARGALLRTEVSGIKSVFRLQRGSSVSLKTWQAFTKKPLFAEVRGQLDQDKVLTATEVVPRLYHPLEGWSRKD